eukprot:ANDGO_01448.mRNA.1 hypothetical protein
MTEPSEILVSLKKIAADAFEHSTASNVFPLRTDEGTVELPEHLYEFWMDETAARRYTIATLSVASLAATVVLPVTGIAAVATTAVRGGAAVTTFLKAASLGRSMWAGIGLLVGVGAVTTQTLNAVRCHADRILVSKCMAACRKYWSEHGTTIAQSVLRRIKNPESTATKVADAVAAGARDFVGMPRDKDNMYDAFVGSFLELQFHGEGTLVIPKHWRIQGSFAHGLPNGNVSIYKVVAASENAGPFEELLFSGTLVLEPTSSTESIKFHGSGNWFGNAGRQQTIMFSENAVSTVDN